MFRELDWEALGQLQFLLMRRITEPLNAGLAAISLVHLENAADQPREYWQQRASGEVMGVLNMVNAWHALIRYKLGELLPRQHIRPFEVQELLDWLTYQLQLVTPLKVEENLMLESSKEALHEAMLLLYSAAYTLGPNVHLVVQSTGNGVWFRVRWAHKGGPGCPTDLDYLIKQLSGNWRLEDTAFEIRTAADFVALSGSQIHLQGTERFCEMAFFVYALGQRPPEPRSSAQVNEPPPLATTEAEELLISMTASGIISDDTTQPLPDTNYAKMIEETMQSIFGDEDLPADPGVTPIPRYPSREQEDPPVEVTDDQTDEESLKPASLDDLAAIINADDDSEQTEEETEQPRIVWARSRRKKNNRDSDESADN